MLRSSVAPILINRAVRSVAAMNASQIALQLLQTYSLGDADKDRASQLLAEKHK